MNGHDYIFRYKDEQTIIDITCSYPQIKCSFDYDENESCININGHLLKYVVIDKYDRKCIYTFDAYSHKELLITFDNPIIIIHTDMYRLLNIKRDEVYWERTDIYPKQIEQLILLQRTILSLLK